MFVKDFMTKKVIYLKPDNSIKEAIDKFVKYRISGVPVLENKKIVGIISEKNILESIDAYIPKVHFDTDNLFSIILTSIKNKDEFEGIRKQIIEAGKILVKDIMKKDVTTIDYNKKIFEAARIMNKYKLNRIPVVKNNKLVGIITRADIMKALE